MKIEILNEKLYLEYEDFIKKFEGGLFFYSIKYKNFLEELLECESHYYIVVDDNEILAVYPMMLKKGIVYLFMEVMVVFYLLLIMQQIC